MSRGQALVAVIRLLAFQARMLWRHAWRPKMRPARKVQAAAVHVAQVFAFVHRQYVAASRVPAPPDAGWHGVLLSYRRPHNLDGLVRAMLRCDGCQAVIVSNNNPQVDLRRWISVTDPRLRIIEQDRRRYPGIRMTVARAAPAPRYLMVDDDVLLHAEQMQGLMDLLCAEPEVPHGVNGERRDPARSPYPYRLDQGSDGAADHLTNVYAITDRHLARYFELTERLGIEDPADLANGEDIILSVSGSGRPLVHDLGPLLRCASTPDRVIATCKSRNRFFEERLAVIDALNGMAPAGPPLAAP